MTKLAVREINENGGLLGRQVELVVLNNGSTPIGSLLAATRAVHLQVTAVIGAHWSTHSLIIAPILQEAGIPMITPGSTNPAITPGRDYVFRVCFLDSFQGLAMAHFAAETLKAKRSVILTNIDEEYSVTLASFFQQAFTQSGGHVVKELSYRAQESDFSEMLLTVKGLKPDVIYLPGYTSDSGLIIKQARKMGITTVFLGGDAWDNIEEIAGTGADDCFVSVPWHPDLSFSGSKHMQQTLTSFNQWPPENPSSPLAYDGVMLLADAITRAGSLDRRSIRNALAATNRYPGATGAITFDQNGDPKHKPIIIVKLKGNKRILQQISTP